MRAIWKGHIRFSLVTIPIRVYGAIETAEKISFRQLHKDDNGPIGYDKRCKKCNEIVKMEDIVKGYEYEPDQYVLLEDEELKNLKLKSTKVVEIEGFVDVEEVHPSLYDTPYYAGPDGEVAAKTYGLLVKSLKDSGKIGVGRIVLRDRETVMLLAPNENGIMLYNLRYPDELRSIKEVPMVDGATPDKEQLKLAQTLIDSMAKKFSDMELTDRYKDALRQLIDAKIAGEEIVTVEEEEKPVVDIMTALKQSIAQAKADQKPMKKATGRKVADKEEELTAPRSKKRKTA
jgi:DNA end-binding protein Ku